MSSFDVHRTTRSREEGAGWHRLSQEGRALGEEEVGRSWAQQSPALAQEHLGRAAGIHQGSVVTTRINSHQSSKGDWTKQAPGVHWFPISSSFREALI